MSKTILVVDDTPENLRLLAGLLAEQGYRARLAPSGAHALAAAQKDPPDLILLDIMMPDMDGYEVCRRLKADPKTESIPVIFISALDEIFDKMTAFSIGGVDYITIIRLTGHLIFVTIIPEKSIITNPKKEIDHDLTRKKSLHYSYFSFYADGLSRFWAGSTSAAPSTGSKPGRACSPNHCPGPRAAHCRPGSGPTSTHTDGNPRRCKYYSSIR